MTLQEPDSVTRDVFAAISGGATSGVIDRRARIALGMTLGAVALPWLLALLMRGDPWGDQSAYAPLSRPVGLMLIRIAPVLAALVALIGTVIASARARTAGGRVLASMGGVFVLFVFPLAVLVAGEHWGHEHSINDEDGPLLIVPFAMVGGICVSIFLGIPLSLLGIWALRAERQPSVDRRWSYGRAAGIVATCVLGAHAALDVWLELAPIALFHGCAALCAVLASAIYSGRARRMYRWLAAVRAGRVSGWRVRTLGAGERVEVPLMPFIARDYLSTEAVLEMAGDGPAIDPYRSGAPHREPVAFVAG